MQKKKPAYETEAALCADFMAWAKTRQNPKWTPYPETAGWDILLAAEDGTQIGVQAKLRFNMKVLHQTIPGSWDACRETGPDFRAILIPERDGMVNDICSALGVTVFTPGYNYYRADNFTEFSPDPSQENRYGDDWHFWSPYKRHELPEFVPDVVAGASAPLQLTKWKIGALRIVATLEARGYVTREDFKRYGLDPRRWLVNEQWLRPNENRGEYVRGAALDFDKQHPEVYPQVFAEVSETVAAEGARVRVALQGQGALL